MPTRKKEKAPPAGSSRRGFLTKLWFALGLVVLAEIVVVAFVFLRPGKKATGS